MQQLSHWLLSNVTWFGLQSSFLLITVMEASGSGLSWLLSKVAVAADARNSALGFGSRLPLCGSLHKPLRSPSRRWGRQEQPLQPAKGPLEAPSQPPEGVAMRHPLLRALCWDRPHQASMLTFHCTLAMP